MACKTPAGWAANEHCSSGDNVERVDVQPALAGEATTVSVTPGTVEFTYYREVHRALVFPSSTKTPVELGEEPMLGFALLGAKSGLRFSAHLLRGLELTSRSWCINRCAGLRPTVPVETPQHSPADEQEAIRIVRDSIAGRLGKAPRFSMHQVVATLVAGRAHTAFDVKVEPDDPVDVNGFEIELPKSLHFLVFRDPTGSFYRPSTEFPNGHGLGEWGEIQALIDLDADGTDELILEWRHYEGEWTFLARREGDGLVVIGGG